MPTNVPGTSAVWISSAVVVPIRSGVHFSSTGIVRWDPVTPTDANAGGQQTGLGDNSDYPTNPLLTNYYGCSILLLPVGATPDDSIQYTSNVIGFPTTSPTNSTDPVTASFTYEDLLTACDPHNTGPWVIWFRPNDAGPEDNTGSWSITTTLVAPESNATMSRYLFSTGIFKASLPLPLPTITRRAKGTPSAAVQPLSNLTDESVETLVDLVAADNTNTTFQYLCLDYGAAVDLGRISVYNVALTGAGASLQCYVHTGLITNGDFSAATAVPATHTPTAPDNDWEFAPVSGTVTKRYLYIVPHSASAATIGDVDVRSTEFTLAAMQNINIALPFQIKTLHEAAAVSLYPVADAVYGGSVQVEPESADLNEDGIRLFTGAMVDVVMTNKILQPGSVTRPLPFVGELIAYDTDDRKVRIITYHTIAPGFAWSLKIEEFGSKKLTAVCRLPDATSANVGRVWRIIAEQ